MERFGRIGRSAPRPVARGWMRDARLVLFPQQMLCPHLGSAQTTAPAAMLESGGGMRNPYARRAAHFAPGQPHCRPGILLPRLRLPPMGPAGFDVVIWGVTAAGKTFRPSDWTDRIAGLTSAFGEDRRLMYSPLVLPVLVGGTRAVIVGHALEAIEPRLFRFLLAFAQDNELQVERMQDALAAPHGLVPPQPSPATGKEPREPV